MKKYFFQQAFLEHAAKSGKVLFKHFIYRRIAQKAHGYLS